MTGSTELTMVVRITASAADASSAWDLKCDLREELLGWMQREHPTGLPRIRTESHDDLSRYFPQPAADAHRA